MRDRTGHSGGRAPLDAINVLAGVWLIISPFVLGIGEPSIMPSTIIAWNFVLVGLIAAVLGMAAIGSFKIWEEWLGLANAFWLFFSPWALGYATGSAAQWNAVLSAFVLAICTTTIIYLDDLLSS